MDYKGRDFTISYKEFGDKNNLVIIFFPPGIGFSSRFESLAKDLSSEYYVITPDMPGVGNSLSTNGNIKNISQQYREFFQDLNIENPIVVGFCHGGSIAVELSKIYPLKKLILMGTGEYFNLCTKILLTIIFAPTLILAFARKLYARILTRFSHFKFHNFTDEQLKLVNQRWMQTIWYSLPKSLVLETETLLISSKGDRICSRKSIGNLERLYPNNTSVSYTCSHDNYIQELNRRSYSDIYSFL